MRFTCIGKKKQRVDNKDKMIANKSVGDLQYEYHHELPQTIDSLNRQRQELCIQNYDHFVNTQHTLHQLKQNLQQLHSTIQTRASSQLESLKNQLNHIQNDTSHKYTQHKSHNAVALQQVSDVVKIVEIPSLVETCLKNGMISEAIDLDDATRHVARNNSDLTLVTGLVRKNTEQLICNSLLRKSRNKFEESQDGAETNYTHLLDKLSSKECRHVPMCLKMISHIRRLQLCRSERELRILFLQCRLIYVQKQLANVDREYTQKTNIYLTKTSKISNVYDYLVSLTDTLKLELFDMVMQFQAVFPSMKTETDDFDDILPSCVLHVLNPYLKKLSFHLFDGFIEPGDASPNKTTNQLTGEQLSKLLGLCMYCGATLARVGADFRSEIASMFSRRVTLEWSYRMQSALLRFISDMKSYDIKSAAAERAVNLQQNEENNAESTVLVPSKIILQFAPLAELTNAYVTALNELRQCCPINVTAQILLSTKADLLEPLCVYLTQSNLSKYQEVELGFYKNMCKCTAKEFIPHVIRCLEKFFAFPVESDVLPREQMDKLVSL